MKTLGKIFLSFIALILLAIVLLIVLVDINSFKPRIEAIAKEHGIALQMKGDLGWAFWPSIGVAINDISIAALETPAQPLAEFKKASLLLALMPLFSGNFQVDHIAVDTAQINLDVDKNGKGNWEALSKTNDSQTTTPPTATSSSDLELSIEKISLTNSALNYLDEKTGQKIVVQDLNFTMTNVNTQGQPFALTLNWILDVTQPNTEPLHLAGELRNRITTDKDFQKITLDQGLLQLIINKATSAPIELDYTVTLQDVQKELSYQGEFQLKKTNARTLLTALGSEFNTANPNALSAVAIKSSFAGDTKKIALDNLALELDKTHFTGAVAITDFATNALKLSLQGDSINVDDYLPPATTSTTEPTATEDTPLPLETLRTANIDAGFTLETMRIKKMALTGIDLQVKAKQGIINQSLTATAYQGAINFSTKTDARGDKALFTFDGSVKGLELTPLLKDVEASEKMDLSGAIQAQTKGSAQGASVNRLMESMDSTASFSGAQVRLSPLNIEEQFCRLVNLVTQNTSDPVSWDNFTEMRQLEGNIVWSDQIITLENFAAGVSQLLLNSTGKINLATDKYEFKLPIKLTEASQAASLKGCSLITTNYWVDRGLSLLRCKGNFGAIDPVKDCGFDKSAVGALTKDFAEYKLREKHGAKIEAVEQKVDEKKQEIKQQVDDKKKDLFNKLQSKLLKPEKTTTESSASSPASAAPATAPETTNTETSIPATE